MTKSSEPLGPGPARPTTRGLWRRAEVGAPGAVASVGVHEAKTHLSRLLERVMAGEEIRITRRGEVVAVLAPAAPATARRLGVDAGRVTVPDDFDEPLPDGLLGAFES